MFNCVMGLQEGAQADGHYGCINADDMGMGKSLMSVTTVWTLLTQAHRRLPLLS